MKTITKIILIYTIAFVLSAFSCGKGSDQSCKDKAKNTPNLQVYSNTGQTTSHGVKVYSQSGVSTGFLEAVDNSAVELFADARAIGYTNALDYGLYIIYVQPNCTASPENQTPSFLVRADNYDGTIYDQEICPNIGMVLAAEMVIKDGNAVSNEYVICNSTDMNYVKNAARFGLEHILIKRNDEGYYIQTETHTTSGHPLIAQRMQ